ncbi:MAG: glycosyltransferase [Myxococcales bacterium]|nr:glycosyltransferase [Myxococcales bacterium]MCB9531314.1 glycosyltransferase [Myxococcales bacterium]
MTGSALAAAVVTALALAVVLYVYLGYPVALAIARRFRRRVVQRAPYRGSVSVLVAAYNEQAAIASKLENLLAMTTDGVAVDIVVASDGSSDQTNAIVDSFGDRGVRLLALGRGGKTRALNEAAAVATGDILVMTDATTEFAPSTLASLLEPFADPAVGCVAADLHYVGADSGVARGTGAYWRYERWLRAREAEVCSVIGCSGALYAVRRHLHRPIHPEIDDDFTMPGEVFAQGFVTVFGDGAVSKESANDEEAADFRMRVRVVVRSLNALVKRRAVLNPARFGCFALAMWSHKVLRYLAPVLLLVALSAHCATVALAADPWRWLYGAALVPHVGLYVAALTGWLAQRTGVRIPFVHIPYYFVLVNAAALVGIFRFVRGDRAVTWDTAR